MIIEIQGIPLYVEFSYQAEANESEFDPGDNELVCIESIELHGYDITDIISEDWIKKIEERILKSIHESGDDVDDADDYIFRLGSI